MRGPIKSISISGSQALISGTGILADGTPVAFNASAFGNGTRISYDQFAISWTTATGATFQYNGNLTIGTMVVQRDREYTVHNAIPYPHRNRTGAGFFCFHACLATFLAAFISPPPATFVQLRDESTASNRQVFVRSTCQTSRARVKSIIALLLTLTLGEVDIVGYITVYHFFVAHMTGTTVHFGNKLAIRDWSDAVRPGVTIFSFVVGSIVGRSIIEVGARARRRTIATITLLIEAGLLLTLVWIRPGFPSSRDLQGMALWMTCLLLALLAAAMGLQTATLTRIGPLTVHTTFVTGMLNKLAQTLSQSIFWVHDQWRAHTTWK
jgi:uncharacterized membrane protein YoaK (UPF0700 family)